MITTSVPAGSAFPTRPVTANALMSDVELRTRRYAVIDRLTTGLAQQADRDELVRIEAELDHPLRGRSYLI